MDVTLEHVNFYLHTINNPNNGEYLTAANFGDITSSAYFSPSKINVFITHGWNNDHTSDVNTMLKQAILNGYDVNVFVVDWGELANLFYDQAKAAVVPVGQIVGGYINQMMTTFGLTADRFRLMGHSLGAHVSGAAGASVNGKVNYIIGLDPAAPGFSDSRPDERIDPTDGDYVQIIHTNGGYLGYWNPIGHSDYYPNSGTWQPGCDWDITGACSHGRSYHYLAESIISSGFRSYWCDSESNWEAGLCFNNPTTMMGTFNIDKTASGTYWLKTNAEPPYAQG